MNFSVKKCFVFAMAAVGVLWSGSGERIACAQPPLVLSDNMAVLRAKMPDTSFRFAGSNAPGQLFFPGEKANLRFVFEKTTEPLAIEVQEISTRNPESKAKGAFTDTSGEAPLIGMEGKPLSLPLPATLRGQSEIEWKNFPLPARFGTYALVLVRGTGAAQTRQFLATIARVPAARSDATIENTPIFGEGQMMDSLKLIDMRAQQYFRMGVRGWRSEMSWNQMPDGTTDWNSTDGVLNAAAKKGMGVMVTLGGVQPWRMPLGEPIPAVNWTPESFGYSGTGDWLMAPSDYPQYGQWIEQLASRYWKNGKGGLWGFENYNEPWEGGGISGWARDALQYRELQKLIATSAKKVDPRIKVLAASSIMNTEDKLYSDGSNEMDKHVDIFTDHYVVPSMSYGPMVANAHGKESMETETWFVNSEYLLAQGVAQFMGAGQKRIAPWHPRALFDKLPGTDDNYFIPTPVVVATAAFNSMVTGKGFEKLMFSDHLPFAFQFGKDADKDALVVVFGKLMPIGSPTYRDQIWEQVNAATGGTITIDNKDGVLQFFDLAGNPMYQKQKSVTLPLTIAPTYIKSQGGPAAIATRLKLAKIEGKRPVEILPRDFNARPGAANTVQVEVHNLLNRAINGQLKITAPATLALKGASTLAVALKAGERKVLSFDVGANPLADATTDNNAFPFSFNFTSDAGNAEYSETLNAAIVPRGTKNVDGNLDDWKEVPGVTAIGTQNNIDATELLRRPWLSVSQENPEATVGELKLAWDDEYLYVAARVNDNTIEANAIRFATREENSYFHTAADDNIEPYKTFIEKKRVELKKPDLSFAQFPYVYRRSPEAGIPFRRDRIQIALDTAPGWHDLKPVANVPLGFHAVPDTDYEYSIYWVGDGENGNSEVWRHLAPGVARLHDFPRQVRGEKTTGAVTGAKSIVKREGNTYIYEAAIPKSELADLNLKTGTNFGFTFKIGNSGGAQANYGENKAVTKLNGLTLHPYWERTPSAGTRWTLTD